MNKLCITVLSAAIAAMPLGATEAMSYNELDITVNSYWDTTGRTGVAMVASVVLAAPKIVDTSVVASQNKGSRTVTVKEWKKQ